MHESKVTIVYTISSLSKQGPVQVMLDIIKDIDFKKFEVIIITFSQESENSLYHEFAHLPVTIIKLNHIPKFNFFLTIKALKNILKNRNIEIIHSHCFRSLIYSHFCKKKSHHVHTIHIYPGFQYKKAFGFILGNLITAITKHFIKKVQYPICCSKSIAKEFLKNDNISLNYILNGISAVPSSDSKELSKIMLGLDPQKKYFISVGRFSPEKNFQFLVKAFTKGDFKNTKLIILGEGKEYNNLYSNSNDNIILPGFKKNVAEYLHACDYYISSSLTEGMPLSVLEAMSHGLPILLSNIPAHNEIFHTAQKINIGTLFDVNNLINATETIEKMLRINKVKNNDVLLAFQKYFTSYRMSKEYQSFYLKILSGRSLRLLKTN